MRLRAPASAEDSAGSERVKVVPCPGAETSVQRPPVRFRDRACDEQAETGARLAPADASPAELLEDQLVLLGGIPGPRSSTRDEHGSVRGPGEASTSSPPGEYLTALSTRLSSTCRSRSPSPRTGGSAAGSARRRGTSSCPSRPPPRFRGRARRGRRRRTVRERPRLDPRRVEDVPDERREPARLVGDQREERVALLGGELAPALLQRRAAPITAAIGLRSSCETSETKSAPQRGEAAELLDGPALRSRRPGCSARPSRRGGRGARRARSRRLNASGCRRRTATIPIGFVPRRSGAATLGRSPIRVRIASSGKRWSDMSRR